MNLSSHHPNPTNGLPHSERSPDIEITQALVQEVSRKVMGRLMLDLRLEGERMRDARRTSARIGGFPCWPD